MSAFIDAVKAFYNNYANFGGRSSRAQYWWVQLFMAIVYIVPYCFVISCDPGSGSWWFWYAILMVWGAANLCPSLALGV